MIARPLAARLVELRRDLAPVEEASPQAIIAALLRMAGDAELLKTPAGAKEARTSLLEAHRLRSEIAQSRQADRDRAFTWAS